MWYISYCHNIKCSEMTSVLAQRKENSMDVLRNIRISENACGVLDKDLIPKW